MWRATLKSLLAKKLRLALTALSVVLGVGFMAGTYVLTDTMSKAFDQLFSTIASDTDLIVRAESAYSPTGGGGGMGGGGGTEGRQPIQASVLDDVLAVDGVAMAHGDVGGYAQFVDPETNEAIGGFGPPTIGLSWDPDSTVVTIREGQAPEGSDQVAMDAATARSHDLHVGDRVEVLFTGPPQAFTISGIVGFGDADNLGGATLALFPLDTAQTLFDKVGVYDSISIDAVDGVSAAVLRTRVQAVLPSGVEAVTSATVADENTKALNEGLGFFKVALLVFAFISLFVGAFIIFNTFSIITAQRTRELGLLRALGASRSQVLVSVLVEALLVGLVASAVGIAVGLLIAIGLKALLAVFGVDIPSTGVQLLPRTIVVSLVIGTVVTLVASIVPARKAARVAPIEALHEGGTALGRASHRRAVVGTAVTGIGIASLLYGLFGTPPSVGQIIGFGAAVTFIGIGILSPLVARPVARVLGAPLRRLGVHGRLGQENAMRNPKRTASTASALMIGLALVSMVTILSASLKASFNAALEETLRADLTVSTSSLTTFSPDVATLIREVPEVAAVSEFRQNAFRFRGADSFLTAVDPTTIDQVATVDMLVGTTSALEQGSILVYKDVAEENGFGQGDTVTLEFPSTGAQRFVVGGIYGENRLVGDWVISLETYERNYTEQLDTFVLVKGREGVSPSALQHAVEGKVGDFPNIQVQDQAAFREKQAGFIDQILGLVTALLLLAVIIALFGIVNTLSLSIFERTREIGLLRAVGMTRRQLRSMVRWESVIIAVFGALLGLGLGVFFGFSLQQALKGQGLSELRIPATQLIVYVVLAGLAGVAAAVLPARKAAKLNVLEAITYE